MVGTLCSQAGNYLESSFCKKHQTFDIYVGYRHYIYYAFSTFSAKGSNDDIYKFGFEDDADFTKWIDMIYQKSTYKFDCEKPGPDDKIIMCSTCVDDYGNRQLVCMYRGEEVVD